MWLGAIVCGKGEAVRTLFITHVGAPGGAEYAMLSLCKHLPDAEVLLLERGPLERLLNEDGIPFRVLEIPESVRRIRRESGSLTAVRTLPAIAGVLREFARACRPYDVIVPVSQKAFVLTVLTRLAVRRPVVWYMNDLIDQAHFSGFMARSMVALANRGVDHIIVNSRASLESWVQAGGTAAQCTVSYSGVDGSAARNIRPEAVAAHRQDFKHDGKYVGVMVGRIAHWKGQHVVLEAIQDLEHVRMVFVGDALFGEQEYKQQLMDFVRSHHMESRVRFLGHRDDVLEIMAAADVVVHSSVAAEPFGRVIVEGMMVGVPVVATDAGGPREIIEHGQSGLLTAPSDAQALQQALFKLSNEPDWSATLAEQGQRRAFALFDLQSKVEEFLAVCAKHAPGPERMCAGP